MNLFLEKDTGNWKHHAFLLRGFSTDSTKDILNSSGYDLRSADLWYQEVSGGLLDMEAIPTIQKACYLKPTSSDKRVVFLEADRISQPAQHALLKITEDTPAHTVIIISLSGGSAIIPTLLSRVYLLDSKAQDFNQEAQNFIKLNLAQRIAKIPELIEDRIRINSLIQGLVTMEILSPQEKQLLLKVNYGYRYGLLAPKYCLEALALGIDNY